MLKGERGDVKMVGLFGSESLGKTSTGYMLTGRLRTHGCLAEFVTDSSGAMPFSPCKFDTHEAAWVHVLGRKLARECEFAMRTNVDTIVSDRTPLDQLAYFRYKHPDSPLVEAFEVFAMEWIKRYDLLFFLPAKGTAYRYEQFREPGSESRDYIDSYFLQHLPELQLRYPAIRVAAGTYQERAEYIYHECLAELLGDTKPKRVVEQVKYWLRGRKLPISEVVMRGSRSVQRFHIASDRDDYDIAIVVDGGPDEILRVQTEINRNLAYIECMCEATLRAEIGDEDMELGPLDIWAVGKDCRPHEV
jgi:nicotinamide riboside kinase